MVNASKVLADTHRLEGAFMTKSDLLGNHLREEFSDNYWSDDAILYAIELIQGFSEADWDVIQKGWHAEPISWQLRLAQIADHGSSQEASELLADMLVRAEDEVALTACDALRDITGHTLKTDVLQAMKARLAELRARYSDSIYCFAMDSLEKQVLDQFMNGR